MTVELVWPRLSAKSQARVILIAWPLYEGRILLCNALVSRLFALRVRSADRLESNAPTRPQTIRQIEEG